MEFIAKDRQYKEYGWSVEGDYDIDPVANKLLTGDKFVDKTFIKCSPYRKCLIPGILILSGNSFGRVKNKLYYKCIPNERSLPVFLIPYQEKNIEFNKKKVDKYVLFKFDKWEGKHPTGIMQQTIGDVSDMKAFEEHQMNCKDVNHSISKFSKQTFKTLSSKNSKSIGAIDDIMSKYAIDDRTTNKIISIDPEKCTDIDDAIGVTDVEGEPSKKVVSVYIANVPLWFHYLKLWNNLDRRVSTIYLTDEKRSMLPTILSENMCSLKENMRRFAVVMDMTINDNTVEEIVFRNAMIKVDKNYVYDVEELLNDEMYIDLLNIANKINDEYKYIDEISDSHHVVQLFMIIMNHHVGHALSDKVGIFRSFKSATIDETIRIPSNLKTFVRTWKSSGGVYTLDALGGHDMMNSVVDIYAHSTSPIRRLVDLVNLTVLNIKIGLFEDDSGFVERWTQNLDYINSQMKSIRKVQNDIKLLDLCLKAEDLSSKTYEGYIVDVEELEDEYYRYSVILKSLSCISSFKTKDRYDLYSKAEYSLHIFNDEYNLKQKIRINRI